MKRFATAMLTMVIVACLVNTHSHFINASLAAYYLYVIMAAGFTVVCAIWLLKEPANEPTQLSWPLIFYFAFTAYSIVNSFLFASPTYKTTYSIAGLLLVIALLIYVSRIKSGLTWVLHSISVLGMLQGAICLLQWLKVLPSLNRYFTVTGTWVNPNVTAMFMALTVPAALHLLLARKGKFSAWLVTGLVFILTGLLLLKCRTAFIGSGVAAYIIFQRHYQLIGRLKAYSPYKRGALLVFALSLLVVSAVWLYNSKKASTESRQRVWKVCLQMIAEKPFTGYGYGSFEKNYNLYQAGYLEHISNPSSGQATAGYVNMAYNELLEISVEGGIPALLLQLGLIGCLLLFPWLKRKKEMPDKAGIASNEPIDPTYTIAYAGTTAYIVMSLVNFTFQAIPVHCVFLIYFVVLSRHPVYKIRFTLQLPNKWKRFSFKLSGVVTIILSGWLLVHWTIEARAHIQLKRAVALAHSGSVRKALRQLQSLKSTLPNAESFWCNYAYAQLVSHQYQEAKETLKKAGDLSANPDIHNALGACYERTGEWGMAIQQYQLAAQLDPQRIKPRYALMKLYDRAGDTLQVVSLANQIIALPAKGNMAEANKYKNEASKVLNKFKSISYPDKVL